MKFIHRIGFRATTSQRQELEALGVKLPPGSISIPGEVALLAFDVDEAHPNWPTLSMLFQQWDVFDMLGTEFSEEEIAAARWLEISSTFQKGYPQPKEDEMGYLQATYDLTDYCERCGTGKKQKAPFQMKGEPKWGRNGILLLNWVFDELFVLPRMWRQVFERHGIGKRPVINRKGMELETVVQLVIEEEVSIVADDLPVEEAACPQCGRTRYLPVSRGPFPPLVHEPSAAMAKTREYFGSGAASDKAILASQALVRDLLAEKVRGVWLKPVKESG